MTVVAATKYVALADMAALVEAGIEVVGENRVQDLEAKHAVYGDAFRWHFIGRLQSNKVKVVNRICELVHSLDSQSAARAARDPGARAGQPRGRGVEGRRRARTRSATSSAHGVARPLDDAAGGRRLRRSRAPWFRRLRELAAEHGLAELSMGTTQDYRVAAEEGATYVRVGSVLFR